MILAYYRFKDDILIFSGGSMQEHKSMMQEIQELELYKSGRLLFGGSRGNLAQTRAQWLWRPRPSSVEPSSTHSARNSLEVAHRSTIYSTAAPQPREF